MGASLHPLVELRRRVGEARSEAQLARWVRVLRDDPRAGARALAEVGRRRLAGLREERRRLERLMARRRALLAAGARVVAGVDEVGMGPLAGPVIAAAVVLPDAFDLPGLDDSKRLARADRERLDALIREQAVAFGIGGASPEEIDRVNIYQAGLRAMRRAVARLAVAPDHVLVDARTIPRLRVAQTAVPHGDADDASIAAASIVAKVHRDAIMRHLDALHPGYGFAHHVGYATREHLRALERLGPSSVHRRSFQPCR